MNRFLALLFLTSFSVVLASERPSKLMVQYSTDSAESVTSFSSQESSISGSLNTSNLPTALTLLQYRQLLKSGLHDEAENLLARRLPPRQESFAGVLGVTPLSIALESGYIPTIRTVLKDYLPLLSVSQLSIALKEARILIERARRKSAWSQMKIVNQWISVIIDQILLKLEFERDD